MILLSLQVLFTTCLIHMLYRMNSKSAIICSHQRNVKSNEEKIKPFYRKTEYIDKSMDKACNVEEEGTHACTYAIVSD